MFALASDTVQRLLFKSVKGVAQSGINLSDLRTLPVPIAPAGEQAFVVRSVVEKLAACVRVGVGLGAVQSRARSLDAAILAKAFRGELVPQDPTDEPASALLARLTAERNTRSARLLSPRAPPETDPTRAKA